MDKVKVLYAIYIIVRAGLLKHFVFLMIFIKVLHSTVIEQ